ncbi:Lactb2 [Symbiodinium natans]|uniref:Lactb2 protein n=1 Tax=Symbiodinium natans TaxID=878477 RepID=A0A812U6J2_9DINO|nr:Lactb2 [Symbiodinium natans]
MEWGCPCCVPSSFEPTDYEVLARLRSSRKAVRLRAQACAATISSVDASEQADEPPEPPNRSRPDDRHDRRNVVAAGQNRFEGSGGLQPQPDWEQLTERVACVLAQNPSSFTLNGTNCYLVGTGRRRILVDTGEQHFGADAFMNNLSRCLAELGVEGLDGIVITHMHHDHYGNVGRLQEKYGPIPVYSREFSSASFALISELRKRDQLKYLQGFDGRPRYNPLKDTAPMMLPDTLDLEWAADRVKYVPGKNVAEKLQWQFYFVWNSQDLLDRLRSGEYPWEALDTGDSISTEGATLTALHMPGHSEDHMCFLLEEEHSLFSGDHVLGWGTTFVVEMKDYMESLRKMLHMHPVSLFPGHGAYIKDGVEILQRYISHRQKREEQAWRALVKRSEPVSIEEIARELYPNTPYERMWMAKSNVEVLFRKFVADGAAAVWKPEVTYMESSRLRRMRALPSGYVERNLPDAYVWAARRSLAKL